MKMTEHRPDVREPFQLDETILLRGKVRDLRIMLAASLIMTMVAVVGAIDAARASYRSGPAAEKTAARTEFEAIEDWSARASAYYRSNDLRVTVVAYGYDAFRSLGVLVPRGTSALDARTYATQVGKSFQRTFPNPPLPVTVKVTEMPTHRELLTLTFGAGGQ